MSTEPTNLPKKTEPKPTGVKGLDFPFEASEKLPEGVDAETQLFKGVHPDTNERVAVTLEGLQAEFGNKLGEKKYLDIAGIAGGTVFFNPKAEATSYRPALGIDSLKGKNAETVAAILAAKE